jgi:RIP metalloprotease RseP
VSETTDVRSGPSDEPWPRATMTEPIGPASPATGDEPSGEHAGPDQAAAPAWIARGPGMGDTGNSTTRLLLVAIGLVALVYLAGAYVFLIIGALLVSIVLHEFGHYWTAKRCGMKVTEFFVGFGPKLWSFRRGETEYGLKLIPAGAYVRIIGMNNLEEVADADEERSYRAQPAPKRVAVVLAGPAMNLLIAFVLLFSLFLIHGRESDDWFVAKVQDNTAASAAGLVDGDRILSVDGDPVTTFDHFHDQLDTKSAQRVDLVVQRGDQQVTLSPVLGWRLDQDTAPAIPSRPALTPGDQIVSVDGNALANYDDLRTVMQQPGDPVTVRIDRGGHPYELIVQRPLTLPEQGASGFLGVRPEGVLVRENPVGALSATGQAFATVVAGTGSAFGRLFSPAGIQGYASQVVDSTQSSTTLVRPAESGVLTPIGDSPPADAASAQAQQSRPISIVGIVRLGSDAAELGLWVFVGLVAMVNLALALINLVPLLPFDGGHAVIGIYEGIRGTIRGEPYRADLTKMMPVVYGVILVLVLLGSTSIMLDVLRPPTLSP